MEFSEELKNTVEDISQDHGLSIDKAFVFFAACNILGIDEDEAYDSVFVGGPNDLGLDFGYIDDQNEDIILIQGKYTGNVNRDNIRAFHKLPEILSNPLRIKELGGNQEVQEFAKCFRKKKTYKCKQYFFHIGCLTQSLKAEFENVIEYDFEKINKEYGDRKTARYSVESPDTIEIPVIEYFKLKDISGQPRCALAVIEIRTLWNLFTEYKTGLFNDNIRLHAGETTEANKAMRQTLKSNEAQNFIYFNNGITMLCESFKEKKDKHIHEGNHLPPIVLKNPQIINGAQTTFTIGKIYDTDIPDNASIFLRIFCPPKNKTDEFRENVIRFNNTQTPVTSRDFRSNDLIQKKLHEAFLKWNPQYFYERKLGLWDTLSKSEKARFRKDSKGFRVLDNQVMAQCSLAWDGKPAAAKNDKRLIFIKKSEYGIYEDVFPDNCFKTERCQEYIIAYELNELFKKKSKEWAHLLRKKQNENDEKEITKLEQDRFLTHFNFFGIASIGYIYRNFLKDKKVNLNTLIEKDVFDNIFIYIKKIFKSVLKSECQYPFF